MRFCYPPEVVRRAQDGHRSGRPSGSFAVVRATGSSTLPPDCEAGSSGLRAGGLALAARQIEPRVGHARVELHQHVYRELKKEHPNLPIFASYTLHNLIKHKGEMLKASQELMAFNDYAAISFYPFLTSETAESAFKWMQESFDSFEKPYAMVETNDTAERTEFPKSKIILNGSPEKQAAYVRSLLELAQRRRFEFVVLFIHQDYDKLWDAIKASAPELFIAWRDCGLIDEAGRERPAFQVWREFYQRSFGR